MGGGGGKGVGATWPDTVKQSGAGGTLTPADRHGSVQVSLPAHLSSFLSLVPYSRLPRSCSLFLDFLCVLLVSYFYCRFICNRGRNMNYQRGDIDLYVKPTLNT